MTQYLLAFLFSALDADSGSCSEDNVTCPEGETFDPCIAPERLKHHETLACAADGPAPEALMTQEQRDRKPRTEKGRRTYVKRKGMVEPVFGQIKQGRAFRQVLLRGRAKMLGE